MARRDEIPPYEIMRQRAASGGAAPKPREASTLGDGGRRSGSPWWVGASSPLVLRLPRGLAALAVLGLLLVVVLAYWVGASRGKSAAEAAYAQQQGQTGGVIGPRGVGGISVSRAGGPGGSQGNGEAGAGGSGGEPVQEVVTTFSEQRERGLNYFRLVYTSREEGEAMAEFMARNGIDIQLVLVDNDRSCIAYAVDRGFRSDERDSDARRYYESQLKELGDLWKQRGSGNSGFSTAYLELYKGPDAD